MKETNYTGCYTSSNTYDAFSDNTFGLSQCSTAATSISGSCIMGNSYCGHPCKSPWGTCTGSLATLANSCTGTCSSCTKTYYQVYSSSMTAELCLIICVTTYGFKYAAINQGYYETCEKNIIQLKAKIFFSN